MKVRIGQKTYLNWYILIFLGPQEKPHLVEIKFITFIDDYSRSCWIYLLSSRDKAFEAFKIFKILIKNQLNCTMKCLKTDNAAEFLSNNLEILSTNNGNEHGLSAAYCHFQNGVAERMNRAIIKMAPCMFAESNYQKILGRSNYYGKLLKKPTSEQSK